MQNTQDAAHAIQPFGDEELGDVNATLPNVDVNLRGNSERAHAHDFRDRDLAAAVQQTESVLEYLDGSAREIGWQIRERYLDAYTNEPLPEPQVHDATIDELS